MDKALRIALERGLKNAGVRFVELLADDEDMPACARVRMRSTTEWLWGEVEREVMSAVLLENTFAARRARALELEQLEAAPMGPDPWLPLRLRAAILYTLYPYDKSIWGQLRMPLFYVLLLLQLCPLYGVQPLFFLALFLLRDKGDEFQLVSYILEFKGLQFVTLGAMCGLLGGAQAQYCMVQGTCAKMGLGGAPGMHRTFWIEQVLFVLNILLVWAAFLLLPLSHQKGALAYEGEGTAPDLEVARGVRGALQRTMAGGKKLGTLLEPARHVEEGQRCCCGCLAFHPQRGGMLRSLLVYDFVVFLSVVCCAALACATSEGWRLRSWLFWCRVLYGLCSLPFLLFMLPPLDRILLHSRTTGYDRYGRCVAPLSLRDRQLRHEIRAKRSAAGDPAAGAAAAGVPLAAGARCSSSSARRKSRDSDAQAAYDEAHLH